MRISKERERMLSCFTLLYSIDVFFFLLLSFFPIDSKQQQTASLAFPPHSSFRLIIFPFFFLLLPVVDPHTLEAFRKSVLAHGILRFNHKPSLVQMPTGHFQFRFPVFISFFFFMVCWIHYFLRAPKSCSFLFCISNFAIAVCISLVR